MRINRGATHNQLMRNPETVAGKSHSAESPHAYAAPLTPNRVQAEDELAEALSAATQDPSRRPPRKKSRLSRVRRLAHRPMLTTAALYTTSVRKIACVRDTIAGSKGQLHVNAAAEFGEVTAPD